MCAPIQVWGDGEGRGFPSEALLQKQGNSSEPLSGLLGPNGNLAPVLVTRGSQVEALEESPPLALMLETGKGEGAGRQGLSPHPARRLFSPDSGFVFLCSHCPTSRCFHHPVPYCRHLGSFENQNNSFLPFFFFFTFGFCSFQPQRALRLGT